MFSIVPPATPDDPDRLMEAARAWLQTSGILAEAVQVGEMVPHFCLPVADGHKIDLDDLLNEAATVIVFILGVQSAPCRRQLAEWRVMGRALAKENLTLVTITPGTLDGCRALRDALGLGFPVLADAGGHVARLFGLAYTPPEPVAQWFATLGFDRPAAETFGVALVPAVYLVDQAGIARAAALSCDPLERPSASHFLEAWLAR